MWPNQHLWCKRHTYKLSSLLASPEHGFLRLPRSRTYALSSWEGCFQSLGRDGAGPTSAGRPLVLPARFVMRQVRSKVALAASSGPHLNEGSDVRQQRANWTDDRHRLAFHRMARQNVYQPTRAYSVVDQGGGELADAQTFYRRLVPRFRQSRNEIRAVPDRAPYAVHLDMSLCRAPAVVEPETVVLGKAVDDFVYPSTLPVIGGRARHRPVRCDHLADQPTVVPPSWTATSMPFSITST